jgi:hypothetical protein
MQGFAALHRPYPNGYLVVGPVENVEGYLYEYRALIDEWVHMRYMLQAQTSTIKPLTRERIEDKFDIGSGILDELDRMHVSKVTHQGRAIKEQLDLLATIHTQGVKMKGDEKNENKAVIQSPTEAPHFARRASLHTAAMQLLLAFVPSDILMDENNTGIVALANALAQGESRNMFVQYLGDSTVSWIEQHTLMQYTTHESGITLEYITGRDLTRCSQPQRMEFRTPEDVNAFLMDLCQRDPQAAQTTAIVLPSAHNTSKHGKLKIVPVTWAAGPASNPFPNSAKNNYSQEERNDEWTDNEVVQPPMRKKKLKQNKQQQHSSASTSIFSSPVLWIAIGCGAAGAAYYYYSRPAAAQDNNIPTDTQ